MGHRNSMKDILGCLLILIGIVLGVWLGVWDCFVGGIVQFINAIKASPVEATGIAWGIAKVLFSGVVGWLSGGVLCAIGAAMLKADRIF